MSYEVDSLCDLRCSAEPKKSDGEPVLVCRITELAAVSLALLDHQFEMLKKRDQLSDSQDESIRAGAAVSGQ